MKSDQQRWNERFNKRGFALGKEANLFLKRHAHILPKGKALDLATGEGKNAVFLAQHGWEVDAVDISPIGLKKVRRLAKENGVAIDTRLADLDAFQIDREGYDVILNFYFLNRRLIPKIKKGLKRGGKVIFETYLVDQRHLGTGGPKDPKYFLQHNELLHQFKDFRVIRYREGIFTEGGKRRALASLIAEKQ
jgi:2-polyprenyl-3-methyl-5-hydroxy-6-metoxy-1,4-benzoquinol methylase